MEIAIVFVLVIVAFAAVGIPLIRGGSRIGTDAASDRTVEEEIARYRDAVRADTVCRRCGQANPPASRFCHECGKTLPVTDSEEFDGTGEAA